MNHQQPCILCRQPDRWNPDHEWNPRPAAPGSRACHRCADRLADRLTDLADRYATLMDADELIPTSSGERGAPGFGPRSPAVDALLVHSDPRTCWTSEHGYGALAVVTRWAKSIREDTTIDTPPDRMLLTVPQGRATMARELRTIRWHWHTVLTAKWLDDFAQEISDVLRSLEHAGRLSERVLRVGPCPVGVGVAVGEFSAVQVWPCGTMLTVKVNATEIKCRACGTVWQRSQWHVLGDQWIDYAALSEELGVSNGTLRRWCLEDEWTRADRPGRPLFSRLDAHASYERRRGPIPLQQAG